MELNAEQIKKALECCGSKHNTDIKYECSNCPLNAQEFDGVCCYDEVLHDNALALINSQEQRIKELTEENEKLTASIKILVNNNSDLEFELAYTYDSLEDAKADTVRKMHKEIIERCIKGGIYPAFVASTIDQVAKEMLDER